MIAVGRPRWTVGLGLLALLAAGFVPGCAMVPRDRIAESQKLTQTLRTENARLKDEVEGLQAQNRDLSDRALDDLRRLSAREEAVERLKKSVQGYQDDRDQLAAAYRRLAASLGRTADESAVGSTADWQESAPNPARSAGPVAHRERGAESVTSKDDGDSGRPHVGASAEGSGP